MTKVVVIGGGYAGLACLIELAKKAPQLELHLVDSEVAHCKITNLHKTFSKPIEDFRVSYQRLAERFNFDFHQQKVPFTATDLQHWQQQKTLPLGNYELPFDWLVVATGATPLLNPQADDVYGQQSLQTGGGPALFERWLTLGESQQLNISLVGAGATGLQVLFELQEQLRRKRLDYHLRLIDLGARTAPQLPEGAHRYIVRKLRREGIDYLPETEYRGQQDGQVKLKERDRQFSLPSDATLLFPGVKRSPFTLTTNGYGQVECAGQLLPEVFSAGDNANYAGDGLNLLTAQAAVRKGKLVAHNIRNLSAGRGMRRYRYQEKGYLLSLGSIDAVGWLGLRCNLTTGFPAIVLKEAMETQYELFLDGIDTYLGFP
ncbi:MAG TPA: FAD-dependent oxidoreductase [Malonomonas sp.]